MISWSVIILADVGFASRANLCGNTSHEAVNIRLCRIHFIVECTEQLHREEVRANPTPNHVRLLVKLVVGGIQSI
jgi:hypothetical protein